MPLENWFERFGEEWTLAVTNEEAVVFELEKNTVTVLVNVSIIDPKGNTWEGSRDIKIRLKRS